MRIPLLRTKLYIPPTRTEWMVRPRLIEQLEGGLRAECKLTLVSAPAGFGKTSLVSAWINTRNQPAAWLTLDASDNDGSRFLSYLYAALHAAHRDFDPEALPLPASLGPDETASLAVAILNEAASLPSKVILVLDDYHVIENEAIHSLIRYWVEHLPPQLHLCVLTRVDPPLPLALLRGRGDLSEIRVADLRFTPAEVLEFLSRATDAGLTAESVRAITQRTEGWVTGLKLAALSLDRQADPNRFVRSFSGTHEYIADFLTDEVLVGQPAAVQHFLLQTSLLDYLSGELCDAVVSDGDSQALLETLDRENLFLIPLDEQRQWYRYHTLFRDLLRKRLASAFPDRISDLYTRAGRWHEAQGLIDEAVRYAAAASDMPRVLSLVERHVLETILKGEHDQAQRWLEVCPESEVRQRPILCAAEAWISIRTLALDEAHRWIDRAARLARRDAGVRPALWEHVATLRAVIARTEGQSPEEQQALIREALDVIAADNLALRGMLNLRLGLSYMDLGREQEADQIFQTVIASGRANASHYPVFGAVYARTVIAHLQGRLDDVQGISEEALRATASTTLVPWQHAAVRGFAYIALGLVSLERNELDAAAYHLHRGITLNTGSGVTELQVKAEYGLGRIALARGERPAAMDLSPLRGGALPRLAAFASALQAHLWLMAARLDGGDTGDYQNLVAWAAAQSLAPPEGYDRDWQIKRQLVYMRVMLALARGGDRYAFGDLSSCLPLLNEMQAAFTAQGWVDRVIEILIVKARVLDGVGKAVRAQEALISALTLAEPRRYVRTFLDEGERMQRLLYRCIEEGTTPSAYAAHLLTQFPQPATVPSQKHAARSQAVIEPLSSREIEVLSLIAEGLTNQEIGRRLSIALGTVKRHTANINGKLNAHTRTQAVAVARSLGILD